MSELYNAGKELCFRNIRGYYTTRLLLALTRLGFFESVKPDEKYSLDTLAGMFNVSKELFRSVLDYLVITGFLDKDESNLYQFSENGKEIIPYHGYFYMMVGAYEPVFNNLTDVLQERLVYGKNVTRDGKEVAIAMNQIENFFFEPLKQVFQALQFKKVLDLGCGNANVLTQICKIKPDAQGVGVDINADAVKEAELKVKNEQLSGRVRIIHSDAVELDTVPADVLKGIDLVVAMFLMHEILKQRSRTGTVAYFRKIADLLQSGGQILVIEVSKNVIFEYKENLLFIPEYELFHDFSNQSLAPKKDWENMLQEAGLEIVETKPIGICQAFGFLAKKK